MIPLIKKEVVVCSYSVPQQQMLKLVHISYSNRVNWEIIQSQRYLKTIDSQVFLQTDL